jgi:hypothetical protein
VILRPGEYAGSGVVHDDVGGAVGA